MSSNNDMASPFATVAPDFLKEFFFDETRAKIRKYVQTHMRIRHSLDASKSMPTMEGDHAPHKAAKKNFLHKERVGVLMVTHRRPVGVKFVADKPINQDDLVSLERQKQKDLIRTRLYPKVCELCPKKASRITSTMLEILDNKELLRLLSQDGESDLEKRVNHYKSYAW